MSQPANGGRPIDVRLTGDLPSCPWCGQRGLIAASVPHGLGSTDGNVTRGTLPVVLCARCDHENPAAGPLIMYLLVHEQVTLGTLQQCAALIQRWVDSIAIPSVDIEQLEEEILAWRQGEL